MGNHCPSLLLKNSGVLLSTRSCVLSGLHTQALGMFNEEVGSALLTVKMASAANAYGMLNHLAHI